jgi:Holliday junction resolvase RusA-like endonuclease
VSGRPLSGQKGSKSSSRYAQLIRVVAKLVVPYPSATPRIDVEIWYKAFDKSRPDVDNVAKPILDALKEIVFLMINKCDQFELLHFR